MSDITVRWMKDGSAEVQVGYAPHDTWIQGRQARVLETVAEIQSEARKGLVVGYASGHTGGEAKS